jgi:hypothetical protein
LNNHVISKRDFHKKAPLPKLSAGALFLSLTLPIKNKFLIDFGCPFARAVAPHADNPTKQVLRCYRHSTLADIIGVKIHAHVADFYKIFIV